MDDISMDTITEEEHLQCLASVLDRFLEAGALPKFSKCAFGVYKVKLLGHRIGPNGMEPSNFHL